MLKSTIFGLLLIISLSLTSTITSAADITVSSFEKLSTTLPYMRVLGKNDMGILVYRYGKKMNLMYSYNDDMTLKWRKSISLAKKNSEIITNIMMDDGLIIVYLSREANNTKVYLQKVVEDFRFPSPSVLLDSLDDYRGEKISVISSPNKDTYGIYYFTQSRTKAPQINLMLVNNKMELLISQQISLPFDAEEELKLDEVMLAPNGQCYFSVILSPDKKQSRFFNKFHVFRFDYKSKQIKQFELTQDSIRIDDVKLKYDIINDKLLICGLYSNVEVKGISGVIAMNYDPSKDRPDPGVYIPFSDSLIKMMNGTKRYTKEEGLRSFHTRDVVIREDGGLVLLTESYFTTSETRSSSGYYPSMFYSSITYNYYHYNDILMISIHPDQSIHWFKQIMKNQVSEGDEGLYASYNLAYSRSNMNIMFNDDVLQNGSITHIKVDGKGRTARTSIGGNSRNDLMLIFRMAKQISYDEVIVPSIYRNKLKIVKINL